MNTADQALEIANRLRGHGTYFLGYGDSDTPDDGHYDCFGFAFNKCYGVKRHRPGFNRGPWASVSDDLNCNSAIEDAQYKRELFVEVDKKAVLPGDLLAYPSFTINNAIFDKSGKIVVGHEQHKFIGHIGIVAWVPLVYAKRGFMYHDLDVVQCHGPNGRRPGIVATDGSIWDQHDHVWPLPQHKTHVLRPIQGRV